jgi:ketosteroid isomerase-like protein
MSTRADIERIIREAYAARVRNDLEACLQLFDPRSGFRLAGSSAASPVAVRRLGTGELREVLGDLFRIFVWLDHEIVSMVIEGSKVAVHGRAKVRSTITGETVETELADFWEIDRGRITSLIEFCDTALAARLMAAGSTAPEGAADAA